MNLINFLSLPYDLGVCDTLPGILLMLIDLQISKF